MLNKDLFRSTLAIAQAGAPLDAKAPHILRELQQVFMSLPTGMCMTLEKSKLRISTGPNIRKIDRAFISPDKMPTGPVPFDRLMARGVYIPKENLVVMPKYAVAVQERYFNIVQFLWPVIERVKAEHLFLRRISNHLNTAHHEFAHAFDITIGKISSSPSFLAAYQADLRLLGGKYGAWIWGFGNLFSRNSGDDHYCAGEVFAEMSAEKTNDARHRPSIGRAFPNTKRWMDEFHAGYEAKYQQSPEAAREFAKEFGNDRQLLPLSVQSRVGRRVASLTLIKTVQFLHNPKIRRVGDWGNAAIAGLVLAGAVNFADANAVKSSPAAAPRAASKISQDFNKAHPSMVIPRQIQARKPVVKHQHLPTHRPAVR